MVEVSVPVPPLPEEVIIAFSMRDRLAKGNGFVQGTYECDLLSYVHEIMCDWLDTGAAREVTMKSVIFASQRLARK